MSVQRFARPLLIVFSILAIAWGTLAFGAVYPWAYYPLVTVCFGVGAAAVAIYRPARAPIGRVAIGLAAIAAIIGLQLVPLPSSTLERVSPGTGRYLRSYDLAYSIALAGDSVDGVSVGTASRPVSLNPAATRIGLLHFIAFAAFTVGLALLLSYAGAMPLIRGVTAIGVVVALVGIVQYTVSGGATYTLKLYGFWTPEFRGAPFGPFINRNHFAGWMLMGLPLAIACGCGAATSFRGPGVRRFIAWLSGSPDAGQMQLMAGASALMALSVIMSNSRSGLLGFAVAALLATALVARRQRSGRGRMWVVLTAIFVIVVVAAWAGLDGLLDRLGTVSTGDESAGGRLGAWKDALTIVSRFPWMGAGLNAFGAAMMEYQTGNKGIHFDQAHNDYLQIVAEGGLLLSAAVLATLVAFVLSVRDRFREAPHEGTTYWARVGAVIGLVAIGVQSLLEFSLQIPANAALFAVLAAIALHRSPNLRFRNTPEQFNYGYPSDQR